MKSIILILSLLNWNCPQNEDNFNQSINHVLTLESKQNYELSLTILDSLIQQYNGCYEAKSRIYIRFGTNLCSLHKCDVGVEYFYKALAEAENISDNSLKAKALMGIGSAKLISKRYDSAIHFYKLALPLYQSNTKLNFEDIIGLYNNIGILELRRLNIETAKKYFDKSIQMSFNYNDSTKTANALFNLGKLYFNQDLTLSESYFEQAQNLALLNEDLILAFKTYKELAHVKFKQKKFEEAVDAFFTYDSLASIHLNSDYSDKILDLETKYRTAEIERENAIKQAQIEVQEQRMIYLYVIAALLFIGIIGIYLYNEQRKKVIRALALQKDQAHEKRINDLLNDQELKSAYAMLAGQEKAHKRIAEELHDNLGSILVTLNMFADSLQSKKDPEAQKELAGRISEIAHQANEMTRQISHSLHSGVLKHFGLEIAIKELIAALNESDAVTVDSHVQITSKLDSDLSMNIYRIVQELVNNTLKHSKATKITLDLNQIKDHLSLIYSDNGVGFDKDEVVNGLGLKNLESRVDRLEGTITTESKPNQGLTTIIEVPVS